MWVVVRTGCVFEMLEFYDFYFYLLLFPCFFVTALRFGILYCLFNLFLR